MLVNSEKGRKFWDLVKDEFIYEERSLEEGCQRECPTSKTGRTSEGSDEIH